MKHVLKSTIAVVALGLFVTSSFAQNTMTTPGFYGGVEVGMGLAKDTTKDASGAFVRSLGGTVNVTQDSAVYTGRIFGGYQINENFSAELGFNQSTKITTNISGVTGGSVAYTGTANFAYSGLDYSALVRPSISTGVNGAFFRLGGHSLTQTADLSITAVSTGSISKSQSGTGTLWGVGYDLPTNKTSTVRIAYTSFNKIAGGADSQGIFSVGFIAKF